MDLYVAAADDANLILKLWDGAQVGSLDECWPWQGRVSKDGYGLLGPLRTHLFSLVVYTGRRPLWRHAGHVCHDAAVAAGTCTGGVCPHRRCINPTHLEWQTATQNMRGGDTFAARNAAKTHCPQGHPYEEGNLSAAHLRRGGRVCLVCLKAKRKEGDAIRKQAADLLELTRTAYFRQYGKALIEAYAIIDAHGESLAAE